MRPSSVHEAATLRAPNGVEFIAASNLAELPWLWHGFSTRIGGLTSAYTPDGSPSELNLGFTPADTEANVRNNRLRLVQAITGDSATPLIAIKQIHSNISAIAPFSDSAIPAADGLLTSQPGILLAIQTADCIPVLIADPEHRAVAAFHAGWRGTVARIVESGIARMHEEFNSSPENLIAVIGQGIGACCYTVGQELHSEFAANFAYAEELFSRQTLDQPHRLDLVEANRRQLLDAGLRPAAIANAGGCTSCQPHLFYSHRASGGHAGRMMSVIGIR